VETQRPVVIAHRGASGYLPEHTLAAKALAHGMGADFIEQDVVLTSDGVPIVLHDITLEHTTDVAERFGERKREDGHYYALDFSLEEVRKLRVHERRVRVDGPAAYPGRFPVDAGFFQLPTLAEEIDLIAGLDQSRGRRTGLYIELKSPRRHRDAGLDLPGAVLAVLDEKGYADRPEQVYLQCFDDVTLRELRGQQRTRLPLIQLIADNSWGEDSAVDYDHLRTESGLQEIARYADGIGPWLSHIYLGMDAQGKARLDPLVRRAHQHGLLVHPYTFRRDELPEGIDNFEQLLELFVTRLGVDGLFTDFPDLALEYIERNALSRHTR
jgi:glycerophosphoryl diester phosphodiesterase